MPKLISKAKSLRTNQTEAEQCLWYHLRAHRFQGLKFKRQKPIGPYIVDFVCIERGLVIEIDGGQHAGQTTYDQQRDAWLQAHGYRVVRLWNNQVIFELTGVLERIAAELQEPSPQPLSRRPGEGS